MNEHSLWKILPREDHFLSIRLDGDSSSGALVDQPLRDLALPSDCLVALIHRDDGMVFPCGQTILNEGDRLTFMGVPESIHQLKQAYGVICHRIWRQRHRCQQRSGTARRPAHTVSLRHPH